MAATGAAGAAESPALSPAEALKTFTLPPGYRLELVASEPLVQDPIVMDWDADGRHVGGRDAGLRADLHTPEPNLDPIGRVVVLEDTNHDGVMDKRTVFADGLVLPRALKVLDHGVLVGEPPNLWLMRDTNGDLSADTKELVTDEYGRREGTRRAERQRACTGRSTTGSTPPTATSTCGLKDGKFEVAEDARRAASGA